MNKDTVYVGTVQTEDPAMASSSHPLCSPPVRPAADVKSKARLTNNIHDPLMIIAISRKNDHAVQN